MKYAFSSNAYLRFPFAEAARRIAAIGYAGIEVMADVPHAWPAYLLPEQICDLRRAVESNHLQIANVNAFMMHAIDDPRQKYWHPSWIEPDRHYRRIRIEHTRRALALAKELGASCITTEPGGPIAPGMSWDASLNIFLDELKPVAEYADQLGVALLIEPEPGLLLETAEHFEQFMDHVNCPAIALNFDIGHFYCVGDDPAGTVHRLARFIRHVHFEDIGANRVHQHLIPGDGAIDLGGTIRALQDVNYDGWVTVELYPYMDDPDTAAQLSLKYLENLEKLDYHSLS